MDDSINWTAVANVLLEIVLPLLAALLFPYLRRLLEQAAERGKYADLATMTARIVLAAEQQFGTGTERLDYALARLGEYAAQRGAKLDEEAMLVLIEAAVYVMNQEDLPAKGGNFSIKGDSNT